jgi:glycosyltransferase involved in cell wall biosynthesis
LSLKIVFLHSGRSYCPEITAYTDFFEKKGFSISVATDETSLDVNAADLIWCMMGYYRKLPDRLVGHEYASLSVPPLSRLKDLVKRQTLPRPNFRVFLNQFVHRGLAFNDQVPFVYRDMGVPDIFFSAATKIRSSSFDFDYVYVGSISRSRGIDLLLNMFVNSGRKILMIGEPEQSIRKNFVHHKNIVFTGRLKGEQIPGLALRSRFALNYIPNRPPFNLQTSTKVLEYFALGLPVVSTDYEWIRMFVAQKNAGVFFISDNSSCLPFDEIERFDFKVPDVTDLSWNNVIEKSGVLRLVETL